MNTPDNITELKPNGVLVFGSNSAGHHGGGAAKLAHEKFGARWGLGEGLSGQSYAFPTLTKDFEKRSTNALRFSTNRLKMEANNNPKKTFYLTKVGLGIAGYDISEIAPLFKDMPDNVIQPKEFEEYNNVL